MNAKLAKKARRYALALLRTTPSKDNAYGVRDWSDAALDLFFTPKQRRRAEALAKRKAEKRVST